jgi:hypothetical protein
MALCAFHYVQVLHYGAHSLTSAAPSLGPAAAPTSPAVRMDAHSEPSATDPTLPTPTTVSAAQGGTSVTRRGSSYPTLAPSASACHPSARAAPKTACHVALASSTTRPRRSGADRALPVRLRHRTAQPPALRARAAAGAQTLAARAARCCASARPARTTQTRVRRPTPHANSVPLVPPIRSPACPARRRASRACREAPPRRRARPCAHGVRVARIRWSISRQPAKFAHGVRTVRWAAQLPSSVRLAHGSLCRVHFQRQPV